METMIAGGVRTKVTTQIIVNFGTAARVYRNPDPRIVFFIVGHLEVF
jgi:hypothetical protein